MSKEILNLAPKAVWEHFYSLTQIPRPSKKEEKVTLFLKEFGEKLNLETKVDHVGNVLIRKPATKGYEDRQTIILQGHIDMVPQKNNDIEHDFENDPIDAYIDGDWVTARGTTLGADNGMGVAATMAVLSDNTLEHGPIEGFFTVDEETGMTGAFEVKEDFLNGDILLNLDSEDEGELYIGCAGGVDTLAEFENKRANTPENYKGYRLYVTGLKGGHSGLDINLGRGNAIKILNRLMWTSEKEHGLLVNSFNSGDIRNAIPREGEAIVAVPEANAAAFEKAVVDYDALLKSELHSIEPDVIFTAEAIETPKDVMETTAQKNLLDAVYGVPNGVYTMVADMPDVVETSTSLGVLQFNGDKIEICTLQRSSVESRKEDLCNMIRSVLEQAGGKVEHSGSYPGWNPNIKSPILKSMKEAYNVQFGKEPAVKVIHAGLECGIINAKYPNLDPISFGPTIRFPHSPDEKVNIATVQKFWDFLVQTLKNAPKK